MSVQELRRLFHARHASPAQQALRLRWSRWRRGHQATARRGHRARRAREDPPHAAPDPPVAAVPDTPPLTDAAWARITPLLPASRRRGKPWRDHRRVLGGSVRVMRHGAAWRALPEECGSWQTAHSRYQRWRGDGTWDRIRAALHATDAS